MCDHASSFGVANLDSCRGFDSLLPLVLKVMIFSNRSLVVSQTKKGWLDASCADVCRVDLSGKCFEALSLGIWAPLCGTVGSPSRVKLSVFWCG